MGMSTGQKLAQGAVGTGAGTLLYTVPTAYRAEVTDIDVCNTTAGALSFSLHLAPVGIAVAASNMLFPAISIAANSMVKWSGYQILNAGDFIQGIGSGSGLTVNISGEESRSI
jgi:hypothetical protein